MRTHVARCNVRCIKECLVVDMRSMPGKQQPFGRDTGPGGHPHRHAKATNKGHRVVEMGGTHLLRTGPMRGIFRCAQGDDQTTQRPCVSHRALRHS